MENYKIIARPRPVGLDDNKKMFIFTNHIQPQGEIIIKILNLLLQSRPHESQGLSRDSNWAGHSKAYCDHIVMACHEYHDSWGSGDTDLSINYFGLRCGLSKSLDIYSQIIAAQCLEFWMSMTHYVIYPKNCGVIWNTRMTHTERAEYREVYAILLGTPVVTATNTAVTLSHCLYYSICGAPLVQSVRPGQRAKTLPAWYLDIKQRSRVTASKLNSIQSQVL